MSLQGTQIYLRTFRIGDEHELVTFHVRNRDYFSKFAASREERYFSAFYQRQLIEQFLADKLDDSRYVFGIFLSFTHQLIGVISLSDVARGPLENAYLGYCLDYAFSNKGYATEAVKIITEYAFHTLNLHRIEAGVMPSNIASQRVLEKNRYEREGLSRKNIKINGIWEDHFLYAIINQD